MKHKTEVLIDADLATVWRMFDDPANMARWQPTLKSFTHRSGMPGEPDAVSELIYDENGREIVMTETITARREPNFLGGAYESNWGSVIVFNHFEEVGANKTRWTSNVNYSFKGIMKFMAFFMQNAIRNRSERDMNRFKLLVETETAGRPS